MHRSLKMYHRLSFSFLFPSQVYFTPGTRDCVFGAEKIFWSIGEGMYVFRSGKQEVGIKILTIEREVTDSTCVHWCGKDERQG